LAAGRRVLADTATRAAEESRFLTRGVVITAEDLTLADWPERAKAAGLNTIGLHAPVSARKLAEFVRSEAGLKFLDTCRKLGLAVEYELHAMSDLLPRSLFDAAPELFRMNEQGARIREGNVCVHSERAMQIVAENAVDLARTLRPTTGRYFYWGDDGIGWCRCPKCRGLSDTEQSLIVSNHILGALRKIDPKTQVAHLAYHNTLPAPKQVKPDQGIFLEYAPIHRKYDVAFEQAADAESRREFEMLDANLDVFGRADARVLEYWLDVSLFSHWKKPAVKLPFDKRVLAADLDMYARRGIRHVTTFAVYIDAEYVAKYGDLPLKEYGSVLTGRSRS
jgi:hypothetical protein